MTYVFTVLIQNGTNEPNLFISIRFLLGLGPMGPWGPGESIFSIFEQSDKNLKIEKSITRVISREIWVRRWHSEIQRIRLYIVIGSNLGKIDF